MKAEARPTEILADRRAVLAGSLALLGVAASPSSAQADPAREPPQQGDALVVSGGPNDGKPVILDMLAVGGPLLRALPQDAASGKLRSASRFNQLVLVRLAPDKLGESYRQHAAEGTIAYSGICTHQACPVNVWRGEKGLLVCACHGSEFDAADGGRAAKGPATRRLPMLPVTVSAAGTLAVAGAFTGKPGPG